MMCFHAFAFYIILFGIYSFQGYKKRLRKILEKAGLLMTQEIHKSLVMKNEEFKQEKISEGEFESLDTCRSVSCIWKHRG